MMPGPIQIAIIVFVIILLFGAKKLPQLARSMGESINEFKKGKEESDLREQVAKAEDSDSSSS
ncbi:MAG: twin-arginine translocase TatA/TatE family subunit [Verrucomicrobiota bacterium]